jgi:hypothetical protein
VELAVAAWLRSLGLERYEEAFHANEIDWEILPELNESDLEKLGLPLGPRKKLLRAIAILQTAPPTQKAAARHRDTADRSARHRAATRAIKRS